MTSLEWPYSTHGANAAVCSGLYLAVRPYVTLVQKYETLRLVLLQIGSD